jgi:chromosome partitioning protein
LTLSKTAAVLHSQPFREFRLQRALKKLKGYDFILIDCQPTLDNLPINAMVAADHVLIPVEPSGFSLKGLADLIDTMREILGENKNKEISVGWSILKTKVMSQAKVSNRIAEDILEPVADHVLKTVIHRDELINRSQSTGPARDIFTFDPKSRGAKEYDKLVEEVLKLW